MLTHRRSLTIEWGHCDPAGIVFNPRYFEFFDWSTALLLAAGLDLPKKDLCARYGITGIPVVETSARFQKPCAYGDVIEIVSSVIGIGRTSFRVAHVLSRMGERAIEGSETRVWAAMDASPPHRLRAVSLPDEVRTALEGAPSG